MTELLTEQQAAALLHVSVKAMQGWRYRGAGPKFVKIDRRLVRYRLEDLQAFVVAALRSSTSDPGPARPDRPGSRVDPRRDTLEPARTPASSASSSHARRHGEVRRVPTWRRHGFPRIRIRRSPST